MSLLDYGIFTLYMLAVVGVGYYFHRKNRTAEDYFVGGRAISPGHVGYPSLPRTLEEGSPSGWVGWGTPWASREAGSCSRAWSVRGWPPSS